MADTTQLRALHLGPEIHVLLRSLVLNRNLVPADGVLLNFTSELPLPLAEVLEGMQREGKASTSFSVSSADAFLGRYSSATLISNCNFFTSSALPSFWYSSTLLRSFFA